MDLKTLFGANLKKYRKLKNLSQDELSEKLDISVKHLSAIERGMAFVSADLLQQLPLHLGVPVAAFFCGENERLVSEEALRALDCTIDRELAQIAERLKALARG